MLCENCHNNEATVSYTEIINGQYSEQQLCQECASKVGMASFGNHSPFMNQDLSIGSLLSSVLGFPGNHSGAKPYTRNNVKCDNCGTTFQDFLQKGKFGCSNCINTFGSNLDDSLSRIHGSDRHAGKKPVNYVSGSSDTEGKQSKESQSKDLNQENWSKVDGVATTDIDKLQEKLNQAVIMEEYEEAACLRDEIRELRKVEAQKAKDEVEKVKDEAKGKGEKDS